MDRVSTQSGVQRCGLLTSGAVLGWFLIRKSSLFLAGCEVILHNNFWKFILQCLHWFVLMCRFQCLQESLCTKFPATNSGILQNDFGRKGAMKLAHFDNSKHSQTCVRRARELLFRRAFTKSLWTWNSSDAHSATIKEFWNPDYAMNLTVSDAPQVSLLNDVQHTTKVVDDAKLLQPCLVSHSGFILQD